MLYYLISLIFRILYDILSDRNLNTCILGASGGVMVNKLD